MCVVFGECGVTDACMMYASVRRERRRSVVRSQPQTLPRAATVSYAFIESFRRLNRSSDGRIKSFDKDTFSMERECERER